MTNAQKNSPMLKAAGLWAKSSVKGGQYLTGRLGGLKVLVMENRDRKSDDDPSHTLFFVEAPDRRQGAGERPQERSGGAGAHTHPGRLRTHQRRSVAASLGIGTGCPTIRRRSTTMMRRSGPGDGSQNVCGEETGPSAEAGAGTDRCGASRDLRSRQAEEDPAPRPALQGSPAGGRTDPNDPDRGSR